MEQFRLIIAIVVSLGIFLLWSQFFAPKSVDTPQETTQGEEAQPPVSQPSQAQIPPPPVSSELAAQLSVAEQSTPPHFDQLAQLRPRQWSAGHA